MKKNFVFMLTAAFAVSVISSCDNTTEAQSTEVETSAVENTSPETKFDPNEVQKLEQKAEEVVNIAATTISFEKTEHDFGNLKQGDKAETVFTFTNTGENPLIISNAKGSCGCTVPQWPKEPIAPGATGEIKVVFNSSGKSKAQKKTVTLTANTVPAQSKLTIKSFVEVAAK